MLIHRLRDKQRTGRREAQTLEPVKKAKKTLCILVIGSTQPPIQSLAGETDREMNRFV
jgi:hypothetical protein